MNPEQITPEQFKALILTCLRSIAIESVKSEESSLLACDERFLFGGDGFLIKYAYAPRDVGDPTFSFYIDLHAEEDRFADVCVCLVVNEDSTVKLIIISVCNRQDEFFSLAEFRKLFKTIEAFVSAIVDFFKNQDLTFVCEPVE